jgi:hypothetical protein
MRRENAELSMSVTLFGRVTLVRPMQLANAPLSIWMPLQIPLIFLYHTPSKKVDRAPVKGDGFMP